MKTTIIILLSAMTVSLSAQNFTIKGHFTDVSNDTLLIESVKYEPEKEVVYERIPVDGNGFFNYSCDIKWAYNAELIVQSSGDKSYFFFVPDENVEIEGPSAVQSSWKIDGSLFYQRLNDVNLLLLPFRKEFDAVRAKYEKGVADGLDQAKLKNERNAANRSINERLWKVTRNYIMNHLDDEVTATILLNQDYVDILPAIRMLSPEVRQGRFKDYIDGLETMFSRLEKEIKAEKSATLELKEGKSVPDFTLKDINGSDFSLRSILGQGKYIVVDFWGSWCAWCIKGFPRMAEYYDKYKDRLEIVGVACYDKEDKWKAAVSRNNVPWLHVFSSDGTTEVRFGVTAYPYKVIVSPKGKVIRCFRGETDDFYKMLDELLRQ